MAVNGINQAHPSQPVHVNAQPSQKSQNGNSKATTVNTAAKQSTAGEAQATQTAAAAENNAGREQGNRQNTGNAEGKGAHVNLYA